MPLQRQGEAAISLDGEGVETEKREKRRKLSKTRKGRTIPWYAKLITVFVLLFVSLLGGLAVGYSVVGNGPVLEAFDIETYKHIYDLVFKM